MTDWDAVPYTPDLAGKVIALHRRIWPGAEIGDEAYHRWQYQDNPAGLALSALAADRAAGELIGQFGALPVRMWVDGEERLAALALNVATDPAARGRGVFTALGRAADGLMAQAGAGLAWALPNENSFPGFIRHLGYSHAGDVPLLARPVNVRRLIRRRVPLPGLDRVASVLARPFVAPLPSTARPVDGVAVRAVERFDEAFNTLWERVRGRQRVMVVRDARYLDWRFRRIPLREYHSLLATVDGEPAGYIVLRIAEIAEMEAGLVADFVVAPAPAGERAGRALLLEALAWFAGHDLDLLASLMLPHAPEYRLLRRAGFFALPKALLPQRFRVVARDGEAFRDLRNWFLTMGDYDVV